MLETLAAASPDSNGRVVNLGSFSARLQNAQSDTISQSFPYNGLPSDMPDYVLFTTPDGHIAVCRLEGVTDDPSQITG